MALSGSFYTNISSHWRLQVEWSATQSIDGNYSDVSVSFYWMGLDSYSAVYASHVDSGSITIEGAVTNFTNTAGLSAGQKKLLGSATTRVYHNADGTKATSIQAYYYLNVTLNGTFYGGQTLNSGTIYLDTIPRASGLTSTCTWIAGVQNLPISISRATTDFHHSVEVRVKTPDAFGGAWVYVGARDNIQTSGTFEFTLAESTTIYQTMHQYESIPSWIRVITYNSAGSMIGYKDYNGNAFGAGIAKISFSNPNIGANISATLSNMYTQQGFAYTGIFKVAGTTIKTFTFDPTIPNPTLTFTTAEITQMYNLTPNSNSVSGQVEVTSKYNGIDINDKLPAPEFDPIFNFTAYVTNSNPVFTAGSISYKDTNSTIATLTGNDQKILQSKSSLTAYVNTACTTKNGATFSKYVVTISGKTGNITTTTGNVNIGAIDAGTDQTLSVKAYDSRGNFAELTLNVSMIPYTNPAMNLSLERNNKFDATTILKVNGTFSNVVIETTPKNSIKTLVYRYKQTGATSFGSDITLPYTTTGTTFTATNTPITLDNTKGFEFEISVTDTFGTVTQTITVGAGVPLVFIDTKKSSVGVNMFPTHSNALDVAGTVYVKKASGSPLSLIQTDYTSAGGAYNYISFCDDTGAWQSYVGHDSARTGNFNVYTKIGDVVLTPMTGGSIQAKGILNMNGNTISSVNHITIADAGVNEGIEWLGGSGWKIFESPDDLTNASGNLQFVTGSTKRMTLDTTGALAVSRVFATGGESHFSNGTYTDPRSGVGQGLKVSGGLATDGFWLKGGVIQTDGNFNLAMGNGQYMLLEQGSGATVFRGNQTRLVFHDQNPYLRVESYNGGYCDVEAHAFLPTSDIHQKKNIQPSSVTAVDKIKATPVYEYNMITDADTDPKEIGLIAQESPSEIVGSLAERPAVNLYAMVTMCWKAIQELADRIDQKAQFLDNKKMDKPTTPTV